MDKIKHISELDAAGKARADQTVRDALLSIVASQGKPIRITHEQLDAFAASHRLIIESDGEVITLRAEKADLVVAADNAKLIN